MSHPQQKVGGAEGAAAVPSSASADSKDKKKKESVVDLARFVDKAVRVKFQGGREASGILKGYDALLNLVLDNAVEYLRDPDDQFKLTNDVRNLGLIVARGNQLRFIEMLLACPNDVKIYDLSSGKSLPEWISDRKRRKLLQKDTELRRRIELIQDFDMPDCSNHVCMSRDGQYIFAAGVYKPRLRCYDVNNLSMKFERCLDAEPNKVIPLSDGYEKFIVMEEDRWVEFHVQYGHYCKLRLPKFCRDAVYVDSVCELYAAGSGTDVYRVNLELGRLMPPFTTDGPSLTSCDASSFHQLFVCGTSEGQVEAWDPRTQKRVGKFDISPMRDKLPVGADTSVSCLKFKDHLHLAAGTGWGQVYIYDIRSNAPLIVKDHNYDLPIKAIEFSSDPDMVLSVDSKVVKIWKRDTTASTFASIEPGSSLNGLCLVPRSGLLVMPNEGQKIFTYYVPALGPAPRWCSFLDNITEELEETETPALYDDYKFVTVEELEQIGLSNLIGTNMLRAYMHGYFCDVRLYNKAKALTNPFAFDDYRKKKIKEKLDEERTHRVIPVKKLPNVNRQLAERLMEDEAIDAEEDQRASGKRPSKKKAKQKAAKEKSSLLKDDRFRALFENPEFEQNAASEDVETLNPILNRLNLIKNKASKQKEEEREKQREREMMEFESKLDDEESNAESGSSSDIEEVDEDDEEHRSSSDDDKAIPTTASTSRRSERKPPKIVTMRSAEEFRGWKFEANKKQIQEERIASLGDRLRNEQEEYASTDLVGNAKEMTFVAGRKKREEQQAQKLVEHIKERRRMRRSTHGLAKNQRIRGGRRK